MKQSTREYIGLPIAEMEARLYDAQNELTTVNFNLATRKMSNYARLKVLRKEIARLKFFIDAKREAE